MHISLATRQLSHQAFTRAHHPCHPNTLPQQFLQPMSWLSKSFPVGINSSSYQTLLVRWHSRVAPSACGIWHYYVPILLWQTAIIWWTSIFLIHPTSTIMGLTRDSGSNITVRKTSLVPHLQRSLIAFGCLRHYSFPILNIWTSFIQTLISMVHLTLPLFAVAKVATGSLRVLGTYWSPNLICFIIQSHVLMCWCIPFMLIKARTHLSCPWMNPFWTMEEMYNNMVP